MLNGSCLCGAIRYSISAPVTDLRACHCRNCQKQSGAQGTVNAVLPSSAFKLTAGKPKRFTAVADSGRTLHRYFCGDCGSGVYSQREANPEMVVVRAGTFDAPEEMSARMKITAHIWTGSRRPWAHIDPACQQHPGQPDAPKK